MERGRDEACRKTMEEERQVPEVHLDNVFMGDENGRENSGVLGFETEGDESRAQYGGSEEDAGIMDMSETDGVASRDWTGVCGHHCAVGQRILADKFDRVVEHDDSDDTRIEDDR